ncbi:hypothetical protein [Peribacillus asahii]|uniref:hypothetical protein n=1 Tax=Peribacillus asahii TaxID=228899 RepID=UPI0020795922|nr:hypothetical protein [Peribacillus asahii]USK71788.1 hypothetical protein LIS76_08545 [Peribacillus asahii]
MIYIAQDINADMGEVLNEVQCNKLEYMLSCIQHYEEVERNRNKQEAAIVLLDKERKMWDAEFLNCTVDKRQKSKGKVIYRLLFKVKKRERQMDSYKVK